MIRALEKSLHELSLDKDSIQDPIMIKALEKQFSIRGEACCMATIPLSDWFDGSKSTQQYALSRPATMALEESLYYEKLLRSRSKHSDDDKPSRSDYMTKDSSNLTTNQNFPLIEVEWFDEEDKREMGPKNEIENETEPENELLKERRGLVRSKSLYHLDSL